MTQMIYTGIGSRETPYSVRQEMVHVARSLAQRGWTLRSGHAAGADLAFETGASQVHNSGTEIYLPWAGFNIDTRMSGVNYIIPEFSETLWRIAKDHHPAWERCSVAARVMHMRNVCQILGFDLCTPTKFVLCWTEGGRRMGGTGQALRIAEAYNIPIWDLAIITPEQVLELEQRVIQFEIQESNP